MQHKERDAGVQGRTFLLPSTDELSHLALFLYTHTEKERKNNSIIAYFILSLGLTGTYTVITKTKRAEHNAPST